MITWITARSISRPAKERLHRLPTGQIDARVLVVFDGACDLATHDGDVVALVLPQIGNGPLNIVLDGTAGLFAEVETGAPVMLEGTQLRVGELGIDLGKATVWEPRPDWDALRSQRAAIASRLPRLRTLCLRHAPDGSLLALLGAPLSSNVSTGAILSTAQKAAEALKEGWNGHTVQTREGAVKLAGLGGGLTPAGDDFLIGIMLWAWLAHPTPVPFCHTILETVTPCTTTLSAAFLRAAARGDCSAPWHALLEALGEEPDEKQEAKIVGAVQKILSHGATSGADSLAGFLFCPSL